MQVHDHGPTGGVRSSLHAVYWCKQSCPQKLGCNSALLQHVGDFVQWVGPGAAAVMVARAACWNASVFRSEGFLDWELVKRSIYAR